MNNSSKQKLERQTRCFKAAIGRSICASGVLSDFTIEQNAADLASLKATKDHMSYVV